MPIEYEATFTQINKNQLRKKLKQVGAVLVKPEMLMKRIPFNPPKNIGNAWLRVRDEGDKITMALKKITGKKITDQKEYELIINDFDIACQLLEALGAKKKSYQETKREIWHLGKIEICLDTWPGLKPICEIEGPNEKVVKQVSAKLGFDWEKAIFGSADIIYLQELGIPKNIINFHTPQITFKNPPRKFKK